MKYIKFIIGLAALALFYGIFASGLNPPGITGEVLRHNRANNINASPLWYRDVEEINSYERDVLKMREEARLRTESEDRN
jgi:hypothetical protein